jgi:Tfp pilus assembly protein PilV
MIHLKTEQAGFALLLSLVVVGVVVSVALTLLDLTIKQVRLAEGSKNSENAFHSANAGAECTRYWRQFAADNFEDGSGGGVAVTCFGVAGAVPITKTDLAGVGGGIYKYSFDLPWQSSVNRCSKVTMITMSSDPDDSALTYNSMQTHIPSYPTNTKTCQPGGKCTVLSVKGYNRGCVANFPLGTIEREVLLEL